MQFANYQEHKLNNILQKKLQKIYKKHFRQSALMRGKIFVTRAVRNPR